MPIKQIFDAIPDWLGLPIAVLSMSGYIFLCFKIWEMEPMMVILPNLGLGGLCAAFWLPGIWEDYLWDKAERDINEKRKC